MSFANIPEKKQFDSNYKKIEYINLVAGSNIIRILDTEAYRTYTHYVKGAYIECIGEECHICKTNKQIYNANPKDFRNIPGWSPKSERYICNVLDKTPAKLCPSCGKYNKKVGNLFQPICECGTSLINVKEEPINKVKVLAKGKELFNQFNVLESSVLDENQEPVGLNNFDINLVVSGTGKDTKIVAVPMPTSKGNIEINPESLFDCSRVSLRLTELEIINLLKGVSIRDILLGRSSATPSAPSTGVEDLPDTEISDDIKQNIDNILNG